jgi:uracil-DNA glycosylase
MKMQILVDGKNELQIMSSVEYIYDTDIASVGSDAIAHQCYCTSTKKTAKGLAKHLFEMFPDADVYSEREEDSTPGTIFVTSTKPKVISLFAQYYPGEPSNRKKDTAANREGWFKEALRKVKGIKSIAFPYKIGCGLAKGDWSIYEAMIVDFAAKHPKIKVLIVSKDARPLGDEDYTIDFFRYVVQMLEGGDLGPGKQSINEAEFAEVRKNFLHPQEDDGPIDTEIEFIDAVAPTWGGVTLEDYTEANVPKGWELFFKDELDIDTGSIHELSKYLAGEAQRTGGEIFPDLHLVYNAFLKVKPENIKVVICGQDPYHDIGQAMGLAFSVGAGVTLPSSLRNIFKELKDDGFDIADPSSGDLTKWCKQGVLLINTALTVRAHEAGSHSKKWIEGFTPSLMRWLNESCGDLVIIAWGNHAQGFLRYFGDRHRKISSAHPSGLSAHKGFFGSKCFSKTNKALKSLGRGEIDWSL